MFGEKVKVEWQHNEDGKTLFTLTAVNLSPFLPQTMRVKMKAKIGGFGLNQTISITMWSCTYDLAWQGLAGGHRKRQYFGRFAVSEASISHRFLSVIKVSDFGERRQEVASFCLSLEKDEAMYWQLCCLGSCNRSPISFLWPESWVLWFRL